jgi:hypothetical protein
MSAWQDLKPSLIADRLAGKAGKSRARVHDFDGAILYVRTPWFHDSRFSRIPQFDGFELER